SMAKSPIYSPGVRITAPPHTLYEPQFDQESEYSSERPTTTDAEDEGRVNCGSPEIFTNIGGQRATAEP
ncbi:hypothetical protein FS842_007588, partial [Serendipita sp. 407]